MQKNSKSRLENYGKNVKLVWKNAEKHKKLLIFLYICNLKQ